MPKSTMSNRKRMARGVLSIRDFSVHLPRKYREVQLESSLHHSAKKGRRKMHRINWSVDFTVMRILKHLRGPGKRTQFWPTFHPDKKRPTAGFRPSSGSPTP